MRRISSKTFILVGITGCLLISGPRGLAEGTRIEETKEDPSAGSPEKKTSKRLATCVGGAGESLFQIP